jgi:hypothetical protein
MQVPVNLVKGLVTLPLKVANLLGHTAGIRLNGASNQTFRQHGGSVKYDPGLFYQEIEELFVTRRQPHAASPSKKRSLLQLRYCTAVAFSAILSGGVVPWSR